MVIFTWNSNDVSIYIQIPNRKDKNNIPKNQTEKKRKKPKSSIANKSKHREKKKIIKTKQLLYLICVNKSSPECKDSRGEDKNHNWTQAIKKPYNWSVVRRF